MKYRLIDLEDTKSNEGVVEIELNEVLETIQDWNIEMDTDYSSIEDFNKREQYWQWEEVK